MLYNKSRRQSLHSCSLLSKKSTTKILSQSAPPCLLLLTFFQPPILAAGLRSLGNPVSESVVCWWQSSRKLGSISSDVVSPCFCVGMIILFQIEFYYKLLIHRTSCFQASVGAWKTNLGLKIQMTRKEKKSCGIRKGQDSSAGGFLHSWSLRWKTGLTLR